VANRLLELLERPVVVGDGAMGTMLQRTGLFTGLCPEELNLTCPDAIKQIHAAYLEAGADMVETNSFGGTRIKLGSAQFGGSVYEVNRAAAGIARDAAGERVVLGSVGPLGHLLEPYGEVAYKDAVASFREQAQALADGGADALIVETMFNGQGVGLLRGIQLLKRHPLKHLHYCVGR
jgi:methionine synthase I (cobalamin-dependent)